MTSPAELLAFERAWANRPHNDGRYVRAIRETFQCSPIRHAMRLNQIIDDPEAISLDPVLCRQIRERREAKMRQRRG